MGQIQVHSLNFLELKVFFSLYLVELMDNELTDTKAHMLFFFSVSSYQNI